MRIIIRRLINAGKLEYAEDSMSDYNTHYGSAMRVGSLTLFGSVAADKVVEIRELLAQEKGWKQKRHTPVLVYRGMSGIAYATALGIELSRRDISCGQVYVRKEHESRDSHGIPLESRLDADAPNFFIFVDDFICSGHTLEKCAHALTGAGWLKTTERLFVLVEGRWMVLGVDPKLWKPAENRRCGPFMDRFPWINQGNMGDPIQSLDMQRRVS